MISNFFDTLEQLERNKAVFLCNVKWIVEVYIYFKGNSLIVTEKVQLELGVLLSKLVVFFHHVL